MEPAGVVDLPEVAGHEAHEMAAALVHDEADRLAGQRLADEDVFAAPLDRAVAADTAHLMIGVVPRLLDAARQPAVRRLPAARRRGLADASCGRSSL